MPNVALPAFDKLHSFLSSPGGIIALAIVFVVFQYTLEMDFLCPCEDKQNRVFGALYFLLPFFTLLWFVLLIDPKKKDCPFSLLRAALVAMVWLITALLDGDVVACLTVRNKHDDGRQIVCLETSMRSAEDQRNINYYKNASYMSAFGLILFLLFISSVYEMWKYRSQGGARGEAPLDENSPRDGDVYYREMYNY